MYKDDFIMSPKIDFAFKEIMFSDKVRKGFLSAVLDIPVKDIKNTVLKNTNMQKIHEDEKQSILDVRLQMNNDVEIDIEIQIAPLRTWDNRSVFYLSRMIAEQTNIDRKYSNIKKCIGINILDFTYLSNEEHFHNVFHIANDKSHRIYTDIMEWHLIELPKLPNLDDGSSIYNWAKFINSERREDFEMLAKKDEYLDEAYKKLDVISQDEEKRIAYTSYIKSIMDRNNLIAEAEERGRDEERRLLINKLKSKGYSDEYINDLLS